ncbi:hypothetical protein [Myxacorys almedinensis]|uniref:Uncharacterized protein n=1 Tax=Myxacorys almedinensis A TaxID=2690445 RepID=A0A8J7Z4U6_9CYAN|nr:hypothetical protein [Myxacorys almedinensis]NDJ16438.1 hypothetical protein [Myxacorys almedinensis A]
MLDEMLETYDEYDESDFESDFEDLEFDESRRRRRRRRPRRQGVRTSGAAWRRQPAPSQGGGRTAAQLKREAEAARARDKQLAREVSTAKEDLGDVDTRLKKVNADLASLRQISLISMLLPRSLDIQRQNLTLTSQGESSPRLEPTTAPVGPGVVSTVSGVSSKLDILPLVLFMSMGRNIGKPGRAGGGMGDNMPIVLLLLMQQQQQQTGTPGQSSSGGLDPTMLILVMMMMSNGGL